jgi:hypothetical protein
MILWVFFLLSSGSPLFIRREIISIVPSIASLSLFPPPGLADNGEAVRKAAARLPGYGPSNIVYPDVFAGVWDIERTVVSIVPNKETPPGPLPPSITEARLEMGKTARYRTRFVPYGDNYIEDRMFRERQRLGANARLVEWDQVRIFGDERIAKQ